MVKISRLTDYGTLLLVYMAREPDQIYKATELAELTHVASPTVSKLLKLMAGKGLLNSYRGAHGGYQLTRNPEEISVSHIIESLEGPVRLTECNIKPGMCELEPHCVARNPWQYINRIVSETLDKLTLADIAHGESMSMAIHLKGETHDR